MWQNCKHVQILLIHNSYKGDDCSCSSSTILLIQSLKLMYENIIHVHYSHNYKYAIIDSYYFSMNHKM